MDNRFNNCFSCGGLRIYETSVEQDTDPYFVDGGRAFIDQPYFTDGNTTRLNAPYAVTAVS
jgi:hypothetical protein